jgi:hypothetical protein
MFEFVVVSDEAELTGDNDMGNECKISQLAGVSRQIIQ